MLEDVESALDDVAALVGLGVVGDRATTLGAAALAVGDLIIAFGDDGLDAAPAQQLAVGPGRVSLVTQRPVGPGAWPAPTQARYPQGVHHVLEHRGVPALPGPEQHHQRPHVPVAQVVDLRRQAAAGAADGVIRRLDAQIRVIRQVPLCPGAGWWRADGRG